MGYVKYNPNPEGKSVGDCAIRALAKALDKTWEEVYVGLCFQGYLMGDLPNGDVVWNLYLKERGFDREAIPIDKWHEYTVGDFANDHPTGTYILGCEGHVLCVQDGNVWDSWDSQDCIPLYVWHISD